MKSFRITRGVQFIYLLLSLGVSFLVGMIFLPFFDATWSISSLTSWGALNLVFFVLIIAWPWYLFYASQKARLVFDEQVLRLEAPRLFKFLLSAGSLRPFTIPYDQIKLVRFGSWRGYVDILDERGKIFKLKATAFKGFSGEPIVCELQKKLPAERFEAGLTPSAWFQEQATPPKANKVINGLVAVVWIAYLSTYPFDPLLSARTWFVKAWQVRADPGGWGYEDVWTYSKDASSTFWVAGWRSSYYRIYHFSGKADREWKLPDSLLGKEYPNAVSGDTLGNPIVWLDDKVFHYENGAWQAIFYENNLQHDIDIVSGEQGWMIACYTESCDADSAHLLKINALTGEWSTLALPETARQQKLAPYSLRWATDGSLLVFARNKANGRVYIRSNDKWNEQEYPVILTENGWAEDYFLDRQNFLWVLLQLGNEFIIEKVDPTGNYRLTQLPSPQKNDSWAYRTIMADAMGRFWVSGGYPYFLAAFTPVWKGQATEIVRYTQNNSNYQGGLDTPPVRLSDGQIWSFGQMITTLDTHLVFLPAPLPAWFAAWNWNSIRMGIILVQMPLQIANYILTNRRKPPKKDKAKA